MDHLRHRRKRERATAGTALRMSQRGRAECRCELSGAEKENFWGKPQLDALSQALVRSH